MNQLFELYLAISGLQGFSLPKVVNSDIVQAITSYYIQHRNEVQSNNYIYNTNTSAWVSQAQYIFNKFTIYLINNVQPDILYDDYFLCKLMCFFRIMLECNITGPFVTAFIMGMCILYACSVAMFILALQQ